MKRQLKHSAETGRVQRVDQAEEWLRVNKAECSVFVGVDNNTLAMEMGRNERVRTLKQRVGKRMQLNENMVYAVLSETAIKTWPHIFVLGGSMSALSGCLHSWRKNRWDR